VLLADQAVLVLGACGGIGRGVVDRFVAEGARVVAVDNSSERCRDVARVHGDRVIVIEGDATDIETMQHAVSTAREEFGALDALVHCVGVFDFYQTLELTTPVDLVAAFDEIFAVNVRSALLAIRCADSALREACGNVVLTLSEAGFYPGHGGVLYSSSKWALRGVVAQLASELAPTIRVNGVAPGGTTGTSIGGVAALDQNGTVADDPGRDQRIASATPLQVLPTPEDHAWAYAYLASRDAGRILTGVVINTDGGRAAVTTRPGAQV
jgi:2,3-dihydroxy-2,3-dihydrophenylpropionate dehydrogenase